MANYENLKLKQEEFAKKEQEWKDSVHFCCPICGYRDFEICYKTEYSRGPDFIGEQDITSRRSGKYFCKGCSVMFRDPEVFSKAKIGHKKSVNED